MALTPCQDCGKLLAISAAVCPHCGSREPHTPEAIRAGCLILTWAAVLAGLALIIALSLRH